MQRHEQQQQLQGDSQAEPSLLSAKTSSFPQRDVKYFSNKPVVRSLISPIAGADIDMNGQSPGLLNRSADADVAATTAVGHAVARSGSELAEQRTTTGAMAGAGRSTPRGENHTPSIAANQRLSQQERERVRGVHALAPVAPSHGIHSRLFCLCPNFPRHVMSFFCVCVHKNVSDPHDSCRVPAVARARACARRKRIRGRCSCGLG